MKRTVPLLLAALACAASPLAAQLPVLLRVPAPGTGAAVWLDSLTVSRSADSTFRATAVYQLGPDTTDRFGPETEVDEREMDCAHARSRGRLTWSMREPRTAPPGPRVQMPRNRWDAVSAADLPIFSAVCGYLLAHSFPVRHPVPDDSTVNATPPQLRDALGVVRRIASEYPRGERDHGRGGQVLLRGRITPEGRLDSVYVLGATRESFATAAATVAGHMRFQPGMADGKPVEVWIAVPITFDVRR